MGIKNGNNKNNKLRIKIKQWQLGKMETIQIIYNKK